MLVGRTRDAKRLEWKKWEEVWEREESREERLDVVIKKAKNTGEGDQKMRRGENKGGDRRERRGCQGK